MEDFQTHNSEDDNNLSKSKDALKSLKSYPSEEDDEDLEEKADRIA